MSKVDVIHRRRGEQIWENTAAIVPTRQHQRIPTHHSITGSVATLLCKK